MSAVNDALKALRGRVQMMVGRAVLAAVNDDATLQTLQIELASDEAQDGVEHFQPYGLAYKPHVGAEAIAMAVGGLRSHAVVLTVTDRRYRLKALKDGEVALYDDQGQKLLLGRDGILIETPKDIICKPEGDFTVDAGGKVTIKGAGETLIDGSSISLGEGGQGAARKGDAVAGGVITGGSSKVKIA